MVGLFYSGREAVESASSLHPDLVLLDLRMPGLDGITAAEKILADKWLPIIMVSGLDDATLADRLAKIGVVGQLVKPVDRRDLGKAIALAVDRCRQEENRKRP